MRETMFGKKDRTDELAWFPEVAEVAQLRYQKRIAVPLPGP